MSHIKTNLVLIGFMGAGKTAAGRLLAKKTGLGFIDLDRVIEKTEGMSIPEIFKKKGEPYFRSLEGKILGDLEKHKDDIKGFLKKRGIPYRGKSGRWIISTGGGMPAFGDNIKILKDTGLVIYLKAGDEEIFKRIKNEKNRPVLGNGGFSRDDVKRILKKREKFYSRADLTVYTEGVSLEAVAEEINIFASAL